MFWTSESILSGLAVEIGWEKDVVVMATIRQDGADAGAAERAQKTRRGEVLQQTPELFR